MTRPSQIIAQAFAAGSFVISALLTALRTSTPLEGLHTDGVQLDPEMPMHRVLSGETRPENLLGVVSQPTNPVLWALLGAVMIAAALHLVMWVGRGGARRRGVIQATGLLTAAIWPWILNPLPVAGLALAALSCGLLIWGLVRRSPPDGTAPAPAVGARRLPLAFVAGWLVVASTSALALYVHQRFGMGLERSVLLGLLLAALVGAWAQLRMQGIASFSLAIIWAMIGFAAATAGASITIATACVLSISALAVVLVRVTT